MSSKELQQFNYNNIYYGDHSKFWVAINHIILKAYMPCEGGYGTTRYGLS